MGANLPKYPRQQAQVALLMEKSFYSPSWYRVSDLRPRLRSQIRIHRQQFRGGLWYVLQDRVSGRFHRFTPAAYLVISLMNGQRTTNDIWQLACRRLGDDALTQDDMVRLLAQLHQADVLHADVSPDFEELSSRAAKIRRRKLVASFANPLSLRLPLLDPDAFLTRTMPFVRPAFSWMGACIFVAIVGYACALAAVHWAALTDNIADRVLVTQSLLLLLLAYPLVKALHELGHAYAVKRWGGEVHELGLMFLVLMPVPYVDASSSAAFSSKWQRALVAGAGILVELMLAALALFLWLEAGNGTLRAFAFNVMLIGGVSTIVFNGNPLLRFDGYYVLVRPPGNSESGRSLQALRFLSAAAPCLRRAGRAFSGLGARRAGVAVCLRGRLLLLSSFHRGYDRAFRGQQILCHWRIDRGLVMRAHDRRSGRKESLVPLA
jgi:putative peptide zinc metalloprotease protein